MPVKGGYLLLAGGGALLLYSGLKGKSFASAFRDVLSGQSPKNAVSQNLVGTTSSNTASDLASAAGVSVPQETGSTGNSAANQRTAKLLLAITHPTWVVGQQWQALVDLWNQESGWNQYAYNPSGATGIPQSLPWTKMPKAAWLPSQGGSASVVAQEQWGFSYIANRYGNPVNALAHEEAYGWY